MSEADEQPAGADVPPAEAGPGAARRGPTWVILAVVAAALLVCCCSAVIGLAIAWSAGLLTAR
ncbi:hypothetical protein GA0074695_0121 [Micromonospora viridifaciens]|uniref:Uncharacterized protein n=1 Tax=Micromonospora viridifaciens TaxID=1881 RepID=A0A1C4U3G2_MICVI|nr:hypothetical protein [Micromonospora viridifaciens]SCE66211.1 hypothetical protein GA0074695_0121 [Micromonospora viridifaciens]